MATSSIHLPRPRPDHDLTSADGHWEMRCLLVTDTGHLTMDARELAAAMPGHAIAFSALTLGATLQNAHEQHIAELDLQAATEVAWQLATAPTTTLHAVEDAATQLGSDFIAVGHSPTVRAHLLRRLLSVSGTRHPSGGPLPPVLVL